MFVRRAVIVDRGRVGPIIPFVVTLIACIGARTWSFPFLGIEGARLITGDEVLVLAPAALRILTATRVPSVAFAIGRAL